MKVFIWDRVENCSPSYHPEGGVVVFAETEARAREVANAIKGCNIFPEEMPREAIDCAAVAERCYIFPDAGCC